MKDKIVVYSIEAAEGIAIGLLGKLVNETKRLWLIKGVDVYCLDYAITFECPGVSLSAGGSVQITSGTIPFGMNPEEVFNRHFNDIMDRYNLKVGTHEW